MRPMSPKDFTDECYTDEVWAFDQPGVECRMDSETGEQTNQGPDNELIGRIVGVIGEDRCVTMTGFCAKSMELNGLTLEHFARVVSLYPDGATLSFETHSDWSVQEWDTMTQRKENDALLPSPFGHATPR
jgi:hypothetical protein